MYMKNLKEYPLIRTIYLYLFALVGLVLVIISGVRFLDMGLKAFIFRQAEEEERINMKQPPFAPVRAERIAQVQNNKMSPKDEITLTEEEKAEIDDWIVQYSEWKNQQEKLDPIRTRREREASNALAMLLVGAPLYLYHWKIIKKDVESSGS